MPEVNLVQHWKTPSSKPYLTSDKVHIWYANLDLSVQETEELNRILSPDEKEKANRFRFEEHRRRFIVARGSLRQLLANYLDISPENIQFEYSDRGKPILSNSYNQNTIQFNVSHSHNLALYAFTHQNRIGIDLEYLLRRSNDTVQIARRFFAPPEYEFISSLEENRQQELFLHIWTIKEAYLKATGEGLSGSLDGTQVFFADDKPIGLAAVAGNSQQAADWLVHSFNPAPNFIATVAVENKYNSIQQENIRFWTIK